MTDAAARPLDLIGLGECMVEFYASEPLGRASSLTRAYGGDVLNALVTAARLGSRTGFVTRVGDDPFGPGLLGAWRAEGIDTRCARLMAGENGVYFISLTETGEREFTYRRVGSAASHLNLDDLELSYLSSGRALLLSGITQAISPSAHEATLAAARLAKAGGARVAFDPNYRPWLWAARGGLAAAQAALAALAPQLDAILPSYPADAPLVGATSLSEALSSFGALAPLVVLKAGAEGAFVGGAGAVLHAPAAPTPRVLDTTGAGDTFVGAFLHFWLRGEAPLECARHANCVAAVTLGHRGAIGPRSPNLEEDEAVACGATC